MLSTFAKILKKPYHLIKRQFATPLPDDHLNFEHNRALWNQYVKTWKKEEIPVQNPDITGAERDSYLKNIGDEWGTLSDVESIVSEYIDPYVTTESKVAEIGVGGGRIATRVAPKSKELWCFDISTEMIRKAKEALRNHANVRFVLMNEPGFPVEMRDEFDFVYAFDVFVHFDLHMMWKYFREIHRVLKDGGRAFLHTSNLNAPAGWDRFASQDNYSVVRHYFISPEIIDILCEHGGFRMVKRSGIDPGSFYRNRDYLFVVEKTA
jgi:SAM-dependent methyltransferase